MVQTYDRMQEAFPGETIPADVVIEGDDVQARRDRKAIADLAALRGQALASGRSRRAVNVDVNGRKSPWSPADRGRGHERRAMAALATLRDDVMPATARPSSRERTRRDRRTAGTQDFNDR